MPNTSCHAISLLLLWWSVLLISGTAVAVTFTHGVASGEVKRHSAVLWTRVDGEGRLLVEVSTDPTFPRSRTLRRAADPSTATDFTARVRVSPLSPNQIYHYRWRSGTIVSEIGTFKTAPRRADEASVSFTFTGDTDGTLLGPIPFHNDFEVFDAISREEADFFVYLGDTVYADSAVRTQILGLPPATTLEEFRDLYKTNRGFAALADLLKGTSTYVLWDDHEVRNDFDGQTIDPALYARGRKAFLEYMPLRKAGFPRDPNCVGNPFFRVFHWGKDVDLILLDERSCRSADVAAVCVNDLAPTLPPEIRAQLAQQGFPVPPVPPGDCLEALFDPTRTLLGRVQKQLFKDALLRSKAKFKFVLNEVPIQQLYALPYDRWEGYAAERAEILEFIRHRSIENVVFLTTDMHANLINEVFIDRFTDPEPIAQEFTTGPVAEFTFEEGIHQFAISIGVDPSALVQGFNGLLDLVGVDCRDLGGVRGSADPRFTYGLVQFDASAGVAAIMLKDQHGTILSDRDPLNPTDRCARTVGP